MNKVENISQVFGGCTKTPMSKKDYTIEMHTAKLQQQEEDSIKQTIARRRNRRGVANRQSA